MEVKVSVIIPVYNAEKYLEESLGSIINQTLREIEIICVNDNSTDDSLKIIQEYQKRDDRIVLFNKDVNEGVALARNLAFDNAKGKYIYCLDSDDILDKNALEMLWNVSEEKNLDLCLFDGKSFYENADLEEQFPWFKTAYTRKGNYPDVFSGIKLYELMVENNDFYVVIWLHFIKREFLVKNNFRFRNVRMRSDNLFILELVLLAERAYRLNKIYVERRVHSESLVTINDPKLEYLGYFTCVVGFISFLNKNIHLCVDVSCINKRIRYMYGKAFARFQELKFSEQEKPCFSDVGEEIISQVLFEQIKRQKRDILELLKVKNDMEILHQDFYKLTDVHHALQESHKSIKNSRSYRLGRKLTWLPRKTRSLFRCVREHGLVYTIRYFIRKYLKN